MEPAAAASGATDVRFTWRAVEGAADYVVEVMDGGGDVVYSGRTADTSFVMPGSARLEPAQYRWWVRATTVTGERVESPARPLTIVPR